MTACGLPNPEAVPLAIKALASALNISAKGVKQCEIVNRTFTDQVVGLYEGQV